MTEAVFRKKQRILADDVNALREMRTSVFLRRLQEAAIAHTEALGAGRDKTLDRGALWVVARVRAVIERMPVYDDVVTLSSWPGETRHVLFPRYYEFADEDGNVLARASAIWLLMDEKTRRMTFPEKFGVVLPAVTTGTELELPTGVIPLPTDKKCTRTVRFSDVDINGHLNNARYADIVEDALTGKFFAQNRLTAFEIEYKSEVKEGRRLTLAHGEADGKIYFEGRRGNTLSFRFGAEYAPR